MKHIYEKIDSIFDDVFNVHDYQDASELAHLVKQGDTDAIMQMAQEMATKVPNNAVLIPMPSSSGRATVTLQLANEIAVITGSIVADVLVGNARESLYSLKKQNKSLSNDDMGIKLMGEVPNGVPVIVDNVYATGTTANAALEVIPDAHILVHSRDDVAQGVT